MDKTKFKFEGNLKLGNSIISDFQTPEGDLK